MTLLRMYRGSSRGNDCNNRFLSRMLGSLAVLLCCQTLASAQTLTQMYSFEPPGDLDGFTQNGVASTVSLNTDPNFASEGTQSLKWEFEDFASFEGAETGNVDLGILNDPPGVDFIRFDFINTNRFAPDDPQPGDPTFANVSVNVFGEFSSDPGETVNIQFFGSEQSVGDLEPGTHQIDIDVTDGGLQVGTATVQGFNDYIADGLNVFGFQIYLNKSFSFADPAFEWTVYIDNIQAGMNAVAVEGDYNGNGVIDSADYAVWLAALGGTDLLNDPTPGVVDLYDYEFWKDNIGGPVAAAISTANSQIPEPSSLLILASAIMGWFMRRQRRLVFVPLTIGPLERES